MTTVPAEAISVFAKWAEEAEASALNYAVSGGKVTVTSLISDIPNLILPAYIEGYPVAKLGENAFKDLDGLVSVQLPETLTEIGQKAFYGCTALEKIILPKSLKASGVAAFSGCTALTRVEYTGSFADWLGIAFSSNCISNPVQISETLYIGGVDITENPPAIPTGLTVLGNWALAGFNGLTEAVIPESVHTLGRGVFSGCDNMISLTTPVLKVLPNLGGENADYAVGLKALFDIDGIGPGGENPYEVPTGLITVHVVGNMTELPYLTDRIFHGFDALATVTLPGSLQSIRENAFNGCSALANINLPSNLQSIGQNAFNGCTALTGIQLPAGLRTVADFAFMGSGLTAISVPASVQSIGFGAFKNCTALESVSFVAGSSLTAIARQTFFGCSELTEIALPASVQSIGDNAFKGCNSMVSITTPVLQTTFNLGLGDEEYLGGAYGWFGDTTTGPNGVVYPVPASLTTVNVIGNMTEIPEKALEGFIGLSTFNIPSGVQSIGKDAFSGCAALMSVHFVETEGWWYASDSTATSGTALLATDLENTTTAATYLKTDYVNYWWKRS